MIASNKIATASLLCLAATTAIAATPLLLNDPVDDVTMAYKNVREVMAAQIDLVIVR